MKVAVGGTFDPLHDGHKKLLKKVFELSEGGKIVVGVTSDRFARATKKVLLRPYAARAARVRRFLREECGVGGEGVKVETVELNDRFGVALDEDFECLVISPETYEVALEINRLRKERGRKPIKIVKVEHLKAANGKPISSTRIKKGEINEHGALLQ